MDEETFKRLLARPEGSHKYDFGHVLVVGGSTGMVGAPLLSARAALRAGAGLVTIGSDPAVIDKLEGRAAEIMTYRLPDMNIMDFINLRKVSVLVVGPGMKPELASDVLAAVSELELPLVVDGGGLAALKENPQLIKAGSILTPHHGEFQRFIEEPLSDGARLQRQAASFAGRHSTYLILKGHPTYICTPKGVAYQNSSGGPGLATAGTGDVLAGMIGGILAQKIETLSAVKAAVYLHGLAGDIVTEAKTEPGVIAGDVIEAIPEAFKLVQSKKL